VEDCGESNRARSTEGSTGCITNSSEVIVQAVMSDNLCKRKRDLIALVAEIGKELPCQERSKLRELLCEHHNVFAIGVGERGKTVMIQMEVDTTLEVLDTRDNWPEGFPLQQDKR